MFGPETAHSPNAEDMNALYWIALAVIAVLGIAINGALVGLIIRGKGRSEARRLRSRRRPQMIAASGLAALATALFVAGVVFTESSSEVEASGSDGLRASSQLTAQRDLGLPAEGADPLQIKASAQQWLWRYEYPAGGGDASGSGAQTFADVFSFYELVVPGDTAVVVAVNSTDVVHSWWIPGLTAKVSVVPGEDGETWFKADEEGVYEGAAYQFSGAAFAAMRTRVRVVSVTEYKAWLEQQAADIAEAQSAVQTQSGSPSEEDA